MRTALIVGSGVSYISGIPGMGEISSVIETGKNVGRHPDANYYIGQGQQYLQDHVTKNTAFIRIVKDVIREFFNSINITRPVNYEDVYYVVKQLSDTIYREYENPAIFPFLNSLRRHDFFKNTNFKQILEETIQYIECIVGHMLWRKETTLEQFVIIPELMATLNLKDVISLNHDLLLEKYLAIEKINYFDGFITRDFRFPNWVGFESIESEPLKVFKVHGSINWVEVRVRDQYEWNVVFKLPRDIYWEKISDHDARLLGPNKGASHLLMGTFNKMFGYLGGIYEELYVEYKKALRQASHLIISGYGFGDKGINSKVSLWLNLPTAAKMVIVHPNKEHLIKCARGVFCINIMNESYTHPKVVLIEKKFEDLTKQDIATAIS